MARIEQEYVDVLQNIEFAIVSTYRHDREMSDYNVMRMLEALIDRYVGERISRTSRFTLSSQIEQNLMENVQRMCEWRLGRSELMDDPEEAEKTAPEPKSVDEIVLCLKKVLKSVKRWNKEGGTRGYLKFIEEYVH